MAPHVAQLPVDEIGSGLEHLTHGDTGGEVGGELHTHSAHRHVQVLDGVRGTIHGGVGHLDHASGESRILGDHPHLDGMALAADLVIVSESAARLLWPDDDPMGRHFTLGTRMGQSGERAGGTVIGVARDVREQGPVADRLPLAIGQLVLSVTSVDGIDAVRLLLNAKKPAWYARLRTRSSRGGSYCPMRSDHFPRA